MQLLLLVFTFFFSGLITQTDPVNFTYKVHDLRHAFEKAAKNEEICEQLEKHLDHYKGNDPVVHAFRAATQGLSAKFVWSPYYKLKYIRTSATIFNQVIKDDPKNAEIRFLRYSIEYYIPRYLNMSSHLQEDKAVFLESLFQYPKSDIDVEVFQIVKRFLLKHPDHLNEQERKKLLHLKV